MQFTKSDVIVTGAPADGAASLSLTAASSEITQQTELVVNELLTYVSFYRNQANANALR